MKVINIFLGLFICLGLLIPSGFAFSNNINNPINMIGESLDFDIKYRSEGGS